MAVYARINAGLPINNGGAVGWAPEPSSTQGIVMQGRTETLADMSALETKIDGRFKHGGSTSWERPGSDLPA